MKIFTWIIQILLAGAFLALGAMKFFMPYADMIADPNMQWTTECSAVQIKIISALEMLGAIVLILPMILKKYRILVPLSAIGLAMTMIGAFMIHISRGEPVITNIVLFVMAVFLTWRRKVFFKEK